jgi:DNA-binding MarR family transcriptional regulator
MTPQSMSEVITALEAKKLIKRDADPNHGRVLPVSLTAKGRRVLADCERVVDELEDEMLAGVSERQRRALLETLIGAVRALGAGFTSAASRQ